MIRFILHWMGLDNASGPQYLFWSGIFGDVTIFGGWIALYLHHLCTEDNCHRWGRHKVGGSPYCLTHKPPVV